MFSRVVWSMPLLLACHAVGCGQPPSSTAPPRPSPHAGTTESRRPGETIPDRPPGPIPSFTEISDAAGIVFQRDDDMRGEHRILEANGGGVALFDYDGDGALDVLLTSGCRLPPDTSDRSATLALFRSLDGERYEEVTLPAGLQGHGYHYGCAAGDFDNDGFEDLCITAFGRNSLWRNNGDGTFADVTDRIAFPDECWSSSAAFGDVNRDGVLDLYITNYVEYSAMNPRLCPDPESPDGYTQCSPTMFEGVPDVLLMGDGHGGFRDVTVEAGITGKHGKGLGVAVIDFNGDARPDIFVANDGIPNFLYVNQTDDPMGGRGAAPSEPRFEEQAFQRGVALNSLGKAEACMGIACGDYDADGWPDLYVTNFYAETNTLYRNQEGQSFVDVTPLSGTGALTRPMVGWGTEFCDFDSDGWLDLYVVNGHVDDFSWRATGPEPYRMRPLLFRNEHNGQFVDVSAWAGPYFRREWLCRGAATGDLDEDGDLDLAVSHQREASSVLRNDTPVENQSLVVKLIGTGPSNRSAVNARVEVLGLGMRVVREVIGGGSFQSSSDRRVHIGLGIRTAAPTLQVRWPSGAVEEWADVPAGRYAAVEGRGLLPLPSL